MTDTRVCTRGCTRARRHVTACPDREACRGCLPREAEFGDLCWGCHRRLELMLADFPTVTDWLATHIPAGSASCRPKQDWQRPGADDGSPIPIDLEVVDLGMTIAASLAGWVEALTDRTSLTGPRLVRTTTWDVTAEVTVTAGFLRTHLTAVECQPFVAALWDELAWLSSQAHALAPWRPEVRRLSGVPCPECATAALVIYGGDVDVTCQECRAMIPAERYGLWVRIVADEVAS